MKILCIDPGQTTGWCILNEEGIPLNFGNQPDGLDGVVDLLETHKVADFDRVVCEDYKILKHRAMAHSGTTPEAVQIIGYVRAMAKRAKVPLTFYPASLTTVQAKHSQVFPTGAHKYTHWVYAFNHGWWWLFQNKYVKSKLMKDKTNAKDS